MTTTFAERLKNAMEQANVSQSDLSRRTGGFQGRNQSVSFREEHTQHGADRRPCQCHRRKP